jgi:hypothetical protein
MRLHCLLSALLGFLLLPYQTCAINDGLTKSVTWDSGSLSVNGKRVYILGAEFHYERMPVPEMWLVSQHHNCQTDHGLTDPGHIREV